MAVKLAVASSLVFADAVDVKLVYTDCGTSSTHAKITGLVPDTIAVPGQSQIVASGVLDADQSGAHFTFAAKKGFITLLSGKGSICEDTTINLPLGGGTLTVKGIECPAKAGDLTVEVDLDVTSPVFEEGENALLTIHLDANADDTGDQVVCVDIDASLAPEPPAPEPPAPAPPAPPAPPVEPTTPAPPIEPTTAPTEPTTVAPDEPTTAAPDEPTTAAPDETTTAAPSGTGVSIQSTVSSLCVDLPGGDSSNGALLWMWECYGGATQQWSFQDGQLRYLPDPSKCVDLLGGNATNGNRLGLWDCLEGQESQKWGWDSEWGTIYLSSSNTATDATKCAQIGGENQGDPVEIWDCTAEPQEIWTVGSLNATVVVV